MSFTLLCLFQQAHAQEGLTIASGNEKITIGKNYTMVVGGKIENSAAAANFVVESDANLIQISESAVNVGSITVFRDSPMKKNNYTYWSSPVSGQQLGAFSPGTNSSRFYQYMQGTNQFATVTPLSSPFVPGKGYAIMAPSAYSLSSTTVFQGTFVGVPNNGDQIRFTLERGAALPSKGFNMIGNPYPSNIDFDKLYAKNQSAIFQTAYFWTNVDPNRPGSVGGNVNYSGNGYAIYNGTGGVFSVQPAGEVGVAPTNIIKVGQGFIIKAKDDANGKTITFDNTMRSTAGESHFFSKQVNTAKDRFWLKLTTPARNVNTILIGYINNASNDFEYDFDSPLMVVGSDSFYSILDDKKLGIQGRKYPLVKSDIVPLGTKHFEKGNYTVSLGDHEGIFNEGQAIYLTDLQKNITTNLSEGDYVFSSEAGEFLNRFQIVYGLQNTLGVDSNVKGGVTVYRDSEDFVVQSGVKNIVSFEVVDMIGRLIIVNKTTNAKEIRLNAGGWVAGIYIIKLTLEDGSSVTKKIRR
ncbi:T9SS type A sorting domain-containing protein [Kaistella daneshvariae]|uniref:T9SS type A sorting domain-containing protein n=1 Tax=Kaistella daneshvariae TaxID=2487074 RepID=UPI0013DDE2D6|nr:T9SS type A sorting domain-containing protein [Kaistella daneshvariae]